MTGGNLMGSHPVGVPYAGVSSYFGQRSAIANPAAEGYRGAVNGVVTGPGGHSLSLSRDSGGGYGIECTTCHDPHAAANARFLRHDMQGSKLCFVCHAL